jgi:hypothetical protein
LRRKPSEHYIPITLARASGLSHGCVGLGSGGGPAGWPFWPFSSGASRVDAAAAAGPEDVPKTDATSTRLQWALLELAPLQRPSGEDDTPLSADVDIL